MSSRITMDHVKRSLDKMNPDAPLKLKHFKESDFHAVCGLREEFANVGRPIEDEESGHGFKRGDRVKFGIFNIGSYREDECYGTVSGIRGEFVRVGIDLYHPSRLRKV